MFETYFAGFSTYSDGVPDEDEEANELDARLGDLDVAKTEYKLAMDALPWDLRTYFPDCGMTNWRRRRNLIKSFYMINQDKNRREEIRMKERLARKKRDLPMNLKRAEQPRFYVGYLNGKRYTLPVQAACCYYCDLCVQTPIHHSWHCFETGRGTVLLQRRNRVLLPDGMEVGR